MQPATPRRDGKGACAFWPAPPRPPNPGVRLALRLAAPRTSRGSGLRPTWSTGSRGIGCPDRAAAAAGGVARWSSVGSPKPVEVKNMALISSWKTALFQS
eukprot:bmy_02903T0